MLIHECSSSGGAILTYLYLVSYSILCHYGNFFLMTLSMNIYYK